MEDPVSAATLISATEEGAWYALLHTHDAVTARIDTALRAAHQVSFSTFEIVYRLIVTEPQPVRTLSHALVSVSPTRASRVIQDLVEAGHLQRGADQADGRVSLISFTEAGRRWAGATLRTFESLVQKFFIEPLDAEDIAAITRIWHKLESVDERFTNGKRNPDPPASSTPLGTSE